MTSRRVSEFNSVLQASGVWVRLIQLFSVRDSVHRSVDDGKRDLYASV